MPPVPGKRSESLDDWLARHRGIASGLALAALAVLVFVAVAQLLAPPSVLRAVPGPADGTLALDSEPSGATVSVDGEARGRTPLELVAHEQAASHQVVLALAGYRPLEQTVELAPGEQDQLTLALEPLPATLALDSDPSGATVQLDGRDAGQTPTSIDDLPAGQHELALALDGYTPWSGAVELKPGDSATRTVRLEALPAALEVFTNAPGAKVALDGAEQGEAPLKLSGLAFGNHELRLEQQGFRLWDGFLWLNPGQTRSIQANLSRIAMVEVAPPQPEQAVAVIVENFVDARPQSGLDLADVVYEALAEGGITRFLALYLTGDAPTVGPIRSARHYYVHWASEYGAALVHIGASPQGFQALRATGLPDLDEGRGDRGFWRIRSRRAPHNAYSSTDGIRAALTDRASGGSWGGLQFKDPEWRYSGEPASDFTIEYGWNYRVSYTYDADTNQYLRTMAGVPHRDAESGDQIRAASVVVLSVPAWVVDTEGRLDMTLTGSGKADYFLDGVHLEGTWRRGALDQATAFLGPDGKAVHFNPGPLWIQVVAPTWARLRLEARTPGSESAQ